MGLAASQARLLTITARKSDCEYQSMAYSHQKIALSRDMNIVSAEYQDALNQTKLVYDFYGTGDQSTPLSYGLLMQPSKLNDYMPSPITDPEGRIVLDAKLAAAVRAAGIPQEGLGSTPSSDIRNKFIQGLINNGIVTPTIGTSIKNVQYNPNAGIGSQDLVTYQTQTISFEEFKNSCLSTIEFDFSDLLLDAGGSNLNLINFNTGAEVAANTGPDVGAIITLDELLNGNYGIFGLTDNHYNLNGPFYKSSVVDKVGSSSYWDLLFESFASYLDPNDAFAQAALEYAIQSTLRKIESLSTYDENGKETCFDISNAASQYTTQHSDSTSVYDEMRYKPADLVGFIYANNKDGNIFYHDAYGLSLTNMTKAFFTYFAQYMEGLATSDYQVKTEKNNCHFVDDDFAFNIVSGVDTSGDNLLIANFYDTLFNQITTKGWVENDQVADNEYLQTMLKNGSMYISTIADDSYYYQTNYATNAYIKEITDEEGIAQAEAKYNREKQKINHKENILDMKMKNLDTEISALTTEYDTVKSVISKNIEKAFKRYNA